MHCCFIDDTACVLIFSQEHKGKPMVNIRISEYLWLNWLYLFNTYSWDIRGRATQFFLFSFFSNQRKDPFKIWIKLERAYHNQVKRAQVNSFSIVHILQNSIWYNKTLNSIGFRKTLSPFNWAQLLYSMKPDGGIYHYCAKPNGMCAFKINDRSTLTFSPSKIFIKFHYSAVSVALN